MDFIRKSLTKKITFGILLGVLMVFAVALGFLFVKSRQMVKKEAYERAERLLANTNHRVEAYLNEAEVATHNIYWIVLHHMQPDSLLAFTRRVVEQNPHVNSCSVSTEPYFFTQYGRYFSAYSVRQGDSIVTACDTEYNFHDNEWYRKTQDEGKAVWVDPYELYGDESILPEYMLVSYCCPLIDGTGRFIGVISTDISLPSLSQAISQEKPYPHSYAILLGKDGHYFVHPDTSRLVKTTIFDEVDPQIQSDLIALGHEMLSGSKGMMDVFTPHDTYICFYAPVQQAGWSLGLICTENDILSNYYRFAYIVVPLFVLGLLFLLVYCRRTVKRFIAPLERLSLQASRIAEGHFGERMDYTERTDVVGRLQNNFAKMQETLDEHITKLRAVSAETEQRNRELALANSQEEEAGRQKTAFLQDMTHQIRTPLNIIMGFAQVLRDDFELIPGEEVENITDTMQKNAISVSRMINMLLAAAAVADNHEKAERHDTVYPNQLAQEAARIFNSRPPRYVPLTVDSQLSDGLSIVTNHDYLLKSLNEILYNAKKFMCKQDSQMTVCGSIVLRLRSEQKVVRFIVEDNGPGIPEESRDSIFTSFHKLDDFGEGLGLGLSISRQFARMLGGDLYLDPSYTDGARFVLEVPLG